jgi:hypothetical protein
MRMPSRKFFSNLADLSLAAALFTASMLALWHDRSPWESVAWMAAFMFWGGWCLSQMRLDTLIETIKAQRQFSDDMIRRLEGEHKEAMERLHSKHSTALELQSIMEDLERQNNKPSSFKVARCPYCYTYGQHDLIDTAGGTEDLMRCVVCAKTFLSDRHGSVAPALFEDKLSAREA